MYYSLSETFPWGNAARAFSRPLDLDTRLKKHGSFPPHSLYPLVAPRLAADMGIWSCYNLEPRPEDV